LYVLCLGQASALGSASCLCAFFGMACTSLAASMLADFSENSVFTQAVKSLMVWAADAVHSLDVMGASPLDLAMEADAQRAIAVLRSI